MVNYPDLEHLFYSGDIEACIIQGEQYLKVHPHDIDALLLLATAYHDIVFYEDIGIVFDAIQNYTVPYLKRILALDPNHKKALQYILHYTLQHQQTIGGKSEDKRHITNKNSQEYIAYAKLLLQSDALLYSGYSFLWQIYETLDEPEKQLQLADEAIAVFEKKFAQNREMRDFHVSSFWIRKIRLLNNLPGIPKAAICTYIQNQVKNLVSKEEQDFPLLAEIAYQDGSLELPVELLSLVLQNDRSLQGLGEVAEKWYGRVTDELDNGVYSPELCAFQLRLERNYPDHIDVDSDLYYSHALQAMSNYPKHYFGYHFAGVYLFDRKEYQKAIPLFEKAIQRHPMAETVRCYIESYLYVYHRVPTIPAMESHPKEIYEEATYLDDWEDDLLTSELYSALCQARLTFYEQAYLAFHAYLDHNAYQSFYDCNPMLFAMCANNLATVHNELGQFIQSAAIAEEALRHSNFWELHAIRIDSLLLANLFEQAKIALDRYFETFPEEEIPFLKHLIFLANKIEVNYQLLGDQDVFEDSRILLYQIYDYALAHQGMDREDAGDLEAAKTTVQNVFYQFVEPLDREAQIAIFEQHAERYPDESHPQYMLMQLYHDVGNYEKSNQAAYAYLSNKSELIIDPFDKARAINFVLKTHVLQEQYDRATIIFDENYRLVKDQLQEKEQLSWLFYSIKLKFEQQLYEELYPLVQSFRNLYQELSWPYDTDMEQVLLWEARSLHQDGHTEKAIAVLDDLIRYDNHDPAADAYRAQWKKRGFFARFRFK
ncbi:tetratricopeptide repeat protein [Sphingobacterium oryzagri]|uniref:Tetratricopeptide repeat protein n=1 Tax=Sphingobacterium oryzagri TaxID=3025669 RepID=A0ABY7WJ01_9SPHI|nr:tetratricopeptide repeat protein [Sphingobacterium sp. KACC 22765]WDF67364.1 tetratricopeptide repeat protein [Sphingobacterium sp. KACC 22765]